MQPNTDDAMSADLVQPLLNWCVDQEGCGCPASSSEWCVMASTYTAEGQLGDSYIAIETGATLDFQSKCEFAVVVLDMSGLLKR